MRHRILERAHNRDFELQDVAGRQEARRVELDARPRRRPGENQIAGQQRRVLRDIFDDGGEAENQIGRGALLPQFAVDRGFDRERACQDIEGILHPRPDAAAAIEILAAGRAARTVAGPVSDGAFVADRHARYMAHRVRSLHVSPSVADNENDLAFVVELIGNFRPNERTAMPYHGPEGAQEYVRIFRLIDFGFIFGRTFRIIDADTDDLAGMK